MALSGSQNFTQTRNELILNAFQIIGKYGLGRTISAEDLTLAVSFLNMMVKAWSTKGLLLWAKEEAVLYLTPNTNAYTIGNSTNDAHTTIASGEIITQLNGAHITGATTLTVDSSVGMVVSNHIGIVLSDLSIHWTTIATIPNATSLTLTLALSAGADDDALVYTYTDKVFKPLRVINARKRTGATNDDIFDIPLATIAYKDYYDLPVKTSGSSPSQFSYNPNISSGVLNLYPCPSDGRERIMFTYERVLDDLDNASNNFDFPAEWLEALTWQLALRLIIPFKRADLLQAIVPVASQMLTDLLDWNREIVSLDMAPNLSEGYA